MVDRPRFTSAKLAWVTVMKTKRLTTNKTVLFISIPTHITLLSSATPVNDFASSGHPSSSYVCTAEAF